jgi:hypothetical protein
MLEWDDLLARLATPFFWVLRAIWFLGWDVGVRGIGWWVGWHVLRMLTLGRYPSTILQDQDGASWGEWLLVELFGLALIGATLALLWGRAY